MKAAVMTLTSDSPLGVSGAGGAMADVGDFIRQRWPMLRQRIDRLDDRKRVLLDQLSEVDGELVEVNKELDALRSAAKSLNLNLKLFEAAEDQAAGKFSKLYGFGEVSIKQATRLTLDALREGMSSHDLHAALSRRYFEDRLPRTSFSPQLSRLNRDGEVEDRGAGWVLTDKGRSIMGEDKILPYNN